MCFRCLIVSLLAASDRHLHRAVVISSFGLPSRQCFWINRETFGHSAITVTVPDLHSTRAQACVRVSIVARHNGVPVELLSSYSAQQPFRDGPNALPTPTTCEHWRVGYYCPEARPSIACLLADNVPHLKPNDAVFDLCFKWR